MEDSRKRIFLGNAENMPLKKDLVFFQKNAIKYFAGLKANASKVGEIDLKWKLFINKEIQGDL